MDFVSYQHVIVSESCHLGRALENRSAVNSLVRDGGLVAHLGTGGTRVRQDAASVRIRHQDTIAELPLGGSASVHG